MSYCVYGIRLRGEREVRYVGVTRCPLKTRLNGHFGRGDWYSRQQPFFRWLHANRARVEIFEIEKVEGPIDDFRVRDRALAAERAMIELCVKLGQRLFNQTHVPRPLRIAA